MKVLIAEDNDFEAELLQHSLRLFGYDVTTATDGIMAYDLIRTGQFRLLVSDWEMPGLTGPELCQRIRARAAVGYIYIILLSSRSGTQNVVDGLNAGADDFITKPFEPQELSVRLRVGERMLSMESRDLTIFSLAKLAESRDSETGAHLERIREYSRLLAQALSKQPRFRNDIDGEYVELIYLTSPLHDIGKVGIPDRVLLKPGRLTTDEFELMKQHTVIGGQTLASAANAYPEARFLQMAQEIAWTHHEKFNGSGYPNGLCRSNIPLSGRIVALADVYDALTTKRVYKEAYCHDVAKSIILEGRGNHFDPAIVDAFLESEEQFVRVRSNFADHAVCETSRHQLRLPVAAEAP